MSSSPRGETAGNYAYMVAYEWNDPTPELRLGLRQPGGMRAALGAGASDRTRRLATTALLGRWRHGVFSVTPRIPRCAGRPHQSEQVRKGYVPLADGNLRLAALTARLTLEDPGGLGDSFQHPIPAQPQSHGIYLEHFLACQANTPTAPTECENEKKTVKTTVVPHSGTFQHHYSAQLFLTFL
ncbi:hypothetical protein LSAT2_004276 [Lamellibrachia satsuma]|nr:hypothetical protein LSAT2_004276 [Lamellibrachia satsuma]